MSNATEAQRPARGTGLDWDDNNSYVSKYFTVGEVTQYDKRRIPTVGSEEEQNILVLADQLDLIREAWGSAIGVTSWFRPYWINLEVGGVENSQHITGGAADIYTMDGRDEEFEQWLSENWGGALGYGVAAGRGFTHIDLRGGHFKKGDCSIRWTY